MSRSSKRQNRKSRYRLMYNFWLDMHKPEEERIADIIERLKNSRAFAKTIRDGIRLIWDLKQGKTDVLTELFPLIASRLAPAPQPKALSDGPMQAQLARIEQMLEQQYQPTPEGQNSIKRLDVGSFAPPSFDDEDDMPGVTLRKASSSGGNATQNFLNSLQALQ